MGRRRPRLSIALAVSFTRPGSGCFDGGDGLVHFRIMEVRREFNRSRLDHACRLAGKDVRKRRRAAGAELAIVGGPHEEIEIAVERAGLRERGFKGGVFGAAVVHAVTQPKHRPVVLRGRQWRRSRADPSCCPRTGSFSVLRQFGIGERGDGRRQLLELPAQRRRRRPQACWPATARLHSRPSHSCSDASRSGPWFANSRSSRAGCRTLYLLRPQLCGLLGSSASARPNF